MIFHFTPQQREQLQAIENEQTAQEHEEISRRLFKSGGNMETPERKEYEERRRIREAKFRNLLQQYEFQEFERIRQEVLKKDDRAQMAEFYALADESLAYAYIITEQREKRGEISRIIATGTDPDGNQFRKNNRGLIIDAAGNAYIGPTEEGHYYQVILTDEVLSKIVELPPIIWEPILTVYDLSNVTPEQTLFSWDYLNLIEDLQKRTHYRDTFNGPDGAPQREYFLLSSVMGGEEMNRSEYMIFTEEGVFNYLKNYALRDYFTAYQTDSATLNNLQNAIRKAMYESPFVLSKYNPEYEPNFQGVGSPEEKAAVPAYTVKINEYVVVPLDKVNQNIWDLSEDLIDALNAGEQIPFNLARRNTKATEITAFYGLSFENVPGLNITKKLTAFDKQVYTAAAALFEEGGEVVTIQNIYEQMQYARKASKNDYKRIADSVAKMISTTLTLTNEGEARAYKDKILFKYHGTLLPAEMVTAVVNGQLTEGAIRLYRYPPLMEFAKGRKQVFTIPAKLQAIPMNRNEAALALDDYLKTQIAIMKGGRRKNKMLYSTIFEATNTTDKKAKSRAKERIEILLDYYRREGFIKGFKKNSDSVEIEL